MRRTDAVAAQHDLVERIAAHAHQVRGLGGDDPVDRELVTSLGLDVETIGRLMKEVGCDRTYVVRALKQLGTPSQEIADAIAHPSTDDTKIAELKRRKLQVKDEIARMQSSTSIH